MSEGLKIFPFYVVVDVSGSMDSSIHALNDELPALKQAVEEDPIVGELARFGLITFADEAIQELPLSDLLDVAEMPRLSCAGTTSYAAAFEILYEVIPHDLDWFKDHGYRALRPVVFFITDGHPSQGDRWREWRLTLIDPGYKYRPHIVSFGFGAVDENILAEVATVRAYAAHRGEQPSTVLKSITKALTNSIVASSRSVEEGKTNLILTEIEGMYEIPLDLV